MANRYWVGGTGNWDTSTTRWGTASGGSGGASVPTASDDVYFDTNSGSGTVIMNTSARTCRSFIFNTPNLGIAGATGTLTCSGDFQVYQAASWTWTAAITFNGGSAQQWNTMTPSGVGTSPYPEFFMPNNVTFNNAAGVWNLGSGVAQWRGSTAQTFTLTAGKILMDNSTTYPFDFTTGIFSSSGTASRSIDITNRYLWLTGVGTVWNVATPTNLTFLSPFSIAIDETGLYGGPYNTLCGVKTITHGGTGSNNINALSIVTSPYLASPFGSTSSFTITGNFNNVSMYGGSIVYGGSVSLNFGNTNIGTTLDLSQFKGNWNNAANTITFNNNLGLNSAPSYYYSPDNRYYDAAIITATPAFSIATNNSLLYVEQKGATHTGAWTVNATGGNGVILTSSSQDFVCTGSLTITNGMFDAWSAAGRNVSVSSLVFTNNSNYRSFNTAALFLTGTGTLLSYTAANTGISFTAYNILVSGGGAAAKSITLNSTIPIEAGSSYLQIGGYGTGVHTIVPTVNTSVWITNQGGTMSFSTSSLRDLDFTGANCAWSQAASAQTLTLTGSYFTLAPGVTMGTTPNIIWTGANNTDVIAKFTFLGKSFTTGTFTINQDATIGLALTIDQFSSNAAFTLTNAYSVTVGGTFSLSASNTLTHTAGSLNMLGNVTCGIYSSSNANTRALLMGDKTWTLTSTGTVWNIATSTNMVLYPYTSKILINNTGATAIAFAGGSLAYGTLQFDRSTSAGSLTISGSNSFGNFIDTGTGAHSLLFTAGTTQTVGNFVVKGATGAVISINSTSTAAHYLVKSPGGLVSCDYVNVAHSIASIVAGSTGGWYAGPTAGTGGGSVNQQNIATVGSGWIFSYPPARKLGSGGVG